MIKFKPFTSSGYTEDFWIKQLTSEGYKIVTGKYWDGTKWVIFASDYAGVGDGMIMSLLAAASLNYTILPIITSEKLFDESLSANANVNHIVRGDFNSIDLVNPVEVNLTIITFQVSPDYWNIYNYSASDFELVGATGTTLVATAISYNSSTKTFTLTFPTIQYINPAPNLDTRLFMRSGVITNVFGTVLDEAQVTFETTYAQIPHEPTTESFTVTADVNQFTRTAVYSQQDMDDDSITADATLIGAVKDLNETIIIGF
jgi:hypothetical protein